MSSLKAPNRWHNADLLRAAVLFFATWVLLRFLWFTRSVVLMTILAILLGVTLSRGVDWLEKFHIKRALGTVLILATLFGIIVGAGFLVAPALEKQTQDLSKKFPAALDRLEHQVRRQPLADAALTAASEGAQQQGQSQSGQSQPQGQSQQPTPPRAQAPPQAQPPESGTEKKQQPPEQKSSASDGQQQGGVAQKGEKGGSGSAPKTEGSPLIKLLTGHAGSFAQMIFPFLANSLSAIAGLIIVIFVAAYIAVEPNLYRSAILKMFPPEKRPRADSFLTELGDLLAQWLVARASAMVIIGLLTFGGLALLKIPAAGALGVIAGLLEFIPFVGPIVSAIPAIAMAVVVAPTKALWVIGLFLLLQQIEGNVVTPLLMKNRLEVPPAVTIIAVAALGIVFGILGMLLAEPLSAAVILAVKRLYVRKIEHAPAPGTVEV